LVGVIGKGVLLSDVVGGRIVLVGSTCVVGSGDELVCECVALGIKSGVLVGRPVGMPPGVLLAVGISTGGSVVVGVTG
jgi:hypothetical protein